jgi:hypothetical protein
MVEFLTTILTSKTPIGSYFLKDLQVAIKQLSCWFSLVKGFTIPTGSYFYFLIYVGRAYSSRRLRIIRSVRQLQLIKLLPYTKVEFTCNAVNSREFRKKLCINCNTIPLISDSIMTRKTAKRWKGDSSVPLEVSRETTASEPVQPEETQGIPDKSREESVNMGWEASTEVEEHDPTPATPLRHPNREGGKRMRSRIRSMSTSTRARIHSYIQTTNANGNGRFPRMKRRRTRTLSSTSRLRFIPMIKRRTIRSAWYIRW